MSDAPLDHPTPTTSAPATGGGSTGRSVAVVLCLVLAAVLTTPAGIAYWGNRTLDDGQRYIETVGPLSDSPEVQAALTTAVTDAITRQVDVEQVLQDAFAPVTAERPRLELLVGPLAGAINAAIERQVRAFFASDVFADAWVRVNTRAQQTLHRVLEGEGGGAVSLEGDDVVLDLSEVVDEIVQRLSDRGMTFLEDLPVPEVDRQVVLMEAPRVKQARTIYAFASPVARWMLPVVALLYLGAFVLARRKGRTTVAIGALVVANALLLALTLAVGRQLFQDELAGTTFGPASKAFYTTMTAYLDRAQGVMLWLGLTLVVAGWFAGANRYGSATRRAAASGLERAGAALSQGQLTGPGRWVAANVGWLRVVAVGLAVVVLLWGNDVSPGRWWWSLALAVVLLALLQALVGVGRATGPHPPRGDGRTAPVAASPAG